MFSRNVSRALAVGLVALGVACSTEPTRQFTVTVIPTPQEGGSATGGGRFGLGSTVTLTAQPNPPYIFGGWRRDDQAIASRAATYTFVDSIDHKFEALFLAPFRAEFLFPRPYDPIPDTLHLVVNTVSPRAVASVRADVAGTKVDLTRPREDVSWTANVDIARLPLDTVKVTLVVTDVAGDTATSVIRVFHDLLPSLDVAAPLDETVARPQISYSASCADNLPGCTLSIFDAAAPSAPPLVTGTGKMSGTLSLAAFEGRRVQLYFVTRDSRFQTRGISRTIYVESSTQLDSIGSAPEPFWDVDPTRGLFGKAATPTVALHLWSSGVDMPISAPFTPASALLTAYGAVVSGGIQQWIDWRAGVSTQHAGYVTHVAGPYALFYSGATSTESVYRYDLAAPAAQLVTQLKCCSYSLGLSSNGDVIVAGIDGALRRYRNGSLSPLPGEPSSTLGDSLPVVDGDVVVYRKTSRGILAETYQLAMNDGAREIFLGPPRSQNSSPLSKILPGQDYAVSNGWVAFTQSNASMHRQVWLRSPSGALREVSPVGIDVLISAVGPDGTVLYTAGGRRFLVPLNGAARDVGGSQGTVRFFDAQPYLILGRSFWRIR